MLDLNSLSNQFDARLEAIRSYDAERSELTREYRHQLDRWTVADPAMNDGLPAYSGAKFLERGNLIKPFPWRWNTRHDAMAWVDSVLSGRAVGAVDGSQIYSDKNYEIPVAVLQTSSIVNRHTNDGDFQQSTEAVIVTPDEFERARVYSFGSEYVDARRFSMECDAIVQLMEEQEHISILLDGALVLSHINILNKNIRDIYIKAIMQLLEASERTRCPVIGFIDTTMPRDITLMMHFCFGLKKSKLSDTLLFSHLQWGERSAAFLCDRDDRRGGETKSVLDDYGRFRNRIAFFYLCVSCGLPVRIEFPAWVHDDGLVDTIADIVRSECVIRGSYPDILIRAHDTAVIHLNEHAIFYEMLDNFCKVHGIMIHKSAKLFHKTMNR